MAFFPPLADGRSWLPSPLAISSEKKLNPRPCRQEVTVSHFRASPIHRSETWKAQKLLFIVKSTITPGNTRTEVSPSPLTHWPFNLYAYIFHLLLFIVPTIFIFKGERRRRKPLGLMRYISLLDRFFLLLLIWEMVFHLYWWHLSVVN